MKVTVKQIIIDAPRTIHKRIPQAIVRGEIGGRAETIQTAAMLRSTRIFRIILVT